MKNIMVTLIMLLATIAYGTTVYATDDIVSKSFTVGNGGMLTVRIEGGDITITPWDKNEVYVQAENIDAEDKENLKLGQRGNSVYVEYDQSERDVKFYISVPQQYNLDLRTSGGNLKIDGKLTGKVRGSTSGGNIDVDEITGSVDISTSGGNIDVKSVSAELNANTSGGDITVGSVGENADLVTSGGSISIKYVGKDLSARTSGGNITLGDVKGTTNVSTAGGNIDSKKLSGKSKLSTAGGNISVESSFEHSAASTAGGNVSYPDANGSVDLSTAGGGIDIVLTPDGKKSSNITTAGGDIRLSLPADAKVTVDATVRYDGQRHRRRTDKFTIHSDFQSTTYEDDPDGREVHATYTLNGGGPTITLKTSNSDIYIKKK